MSVIEVTGSEGSDGPAGAQALLLLAVPLNARVLTELASGPRSLEDLRNDAGSLPPTTMRGYLRSLAAAGVVEKRRHGGFPGSVDYRLTAAGQDLLGVAETFAAWLASSPQGPRSLGTAAAKRATRVLVEAWSTGMVRVLAARPCSLTELDGIIAGLSYPALERRLSSLRRFGFVRAAAGGRRGTPFELSDWLRGAAAPLDAAARWERRWLASAPEPRPA